MKPKKRSKGKYPYKGTWYKSRFEQNIARYLDSISCPFKYEEVTYFYRHPVKNGRCLDCESKNVVRFRKYTPDWLIPVRDQDIIIESKGKFDQAGRSMMASVREEYPTLDIRFIFQRNNKISRSSKTRYSDWADRHGFPHYIVKGGIYIPDEWISI